MSLLIGGILSILKNKQGGYLWKAVLAMFVVYCIHILELKESFFYLKYKLCTNKLIYNKQGLSCSVKLLVTTTSSIA